MSQDGDPDILLSPLDRLDVSSSGEGAPSSPSSAKRPFSELEECDEPELEFVGMRTRAERDAELLRDAVDISGDDPASTMPVVEPHEESSAPQSEVRVKAETESPPPPPG